MAGELTHDPMACHRLAVTGMLLGMTGAAGDVDKSIEAVLRHPGGAIRFGKPCRDPECIKVIADIAIRVAETAPMSDVFTGRLADRVDKATFLERGRAQLKNRKVGIYYTEAHKKLLAENIAECDATRFAHIKSARLDD